MNKGKILGRFSIVPLDIYRIQTGKFNTLLNVRLHNGKVLPTVGDDLADPKGSFMSHMSRLLVDVAWHIRTVHIYELRKGTILPKNLTLIHERYEEYSLQATTPLTPQELDKTLANFFLKYTKQLTLQDLPSFVQLEQIYNGRIRFRQSQINKNESLL